MTRISGGYGSALLASALEVCDQVHAIAYLEASNTLLECLEGITGNEELPPEDRQLALDAYNAEVANQETAAEDWNVQRTRFLEMQQ